ncbi:hypothetical protein BJ508DRAFT_417072 [Ascobolus immersus RN42]|uniref:DUF7580 domain-containing protein n=1 Tax=Ascobolus immersus RN42 TaxID=1160509 RepID=A0A3N4HWA1_ASCIM|nr:hypothetical protein BJ508DRAFT_417072 [Ascobolus immersus RN42]
MSGFEIAGIVLGALPLLLELATDSMSHYEQAKRTFLFSSRNKAKLNKTLSKFYQDLAYETLELQYTLDKVFNKRLPGASLENMAVRLAVVERSNWDPRKDPKVVECLNKMFPTEMERTLFVSTMRRVLRIFFKLARDSIEPAMSKEYKDYNLMGRVLVEFQSEKNRPRWKFHERRRFMNTAEERENLMQDLRQANKRLTRIVDSRGHRDKERESTRPDPLVDSIEKTNEPKQALCQEAEVSYQCTSTHLRKLSSNLFGALRTMWNQNCCCSKEHEAAICLEICQSKEMETHRESIREITMVVCSRREWREVIVTIMPTGQDLVSSNSRVHLPAQQRSICEAIGDCDMKFAAIHLQLESYGDNLHRLLPPELRTRNLEIHHQHDATTTELSLAQLLENQDLAPSKLTRFKIASILAHSLLQLYESPWSSSRWDKNHLAFFRTADGKPDYDRPYLATSFKEDSFYSAQEDIPEDAKLMHRKIGILRLAILLLELYKWKPIKRLRIAEDGPEGLLSTDHAAVFRLLEGYRTEFPEYFQSVAGCLDMPWRRDSGYHLNISFDDENTRTGFYKEVILPLERQMEYLEPMDSDASKSTASSTAPRAKKRWPWKR